MKIAYLISTIKSKSMGQGGHYHSLALTEKLMRRSCDTFIISIGTAESQAIVTGNARSYSVISNVIGLPRVLGRLRKIIETERPDVIHAFDNTSYLWARIISHLYGLPCFLTKCGGANPKLYWPYSRDIIVYSGENLDYFKGKRKFLGTDVYLVPNRVERANSDWERIGAMHRVIHAQHDYESIFLRISRIGKYYEQSIMQMVRLVHRLRSDGIDCCAVLVGAVEDAETLEKLTTYGGEHLYAFNDRKYTRSASELIDVADLVVGTGRSFMEGASLGKVMLAPIQGGNLPVLVDERVFPHALHYNFSERLRIDSYDEEENYLAIREIFSNPVELARKRAYSQLMYESSFDGEKLIEKHLRIYSVRKARTMPHFLDGLLHSLFVLRKYLV